MSDDSTNTLEAEFGCPPPPSLSELADDPTFIARWTGGEVSMEKARQCAKNGAATKAADEISKQRLIPSPPQPAQKRKKPSTRSALADFLRRKGSE